MGWRGGFFDAPDMLLFNSRLDVKMVSFAGISVRCSRRECRIEVCLDVWLLLKTTCELKFRVEAMPVYGIYMLFSFPRTCFREFSLQKSALRQPILLSTTGILLSLCKLVCRSVALVAFPSDFFDSSFFFDFSIFFSMFFNSRYSSRSRSVCVLSYCCEAKPAAFGVLSDCLAGTAWPND